MYARMAPCGVWPGSRSHTTAAGSAERVFELLDADEEHPDPVSASVSTSTSTDGQPERVAGHVAFDSVSFRYHQDEPLIDDLPLTVEPGQTVAIVGPTGAGKTTLVNLLLRFYDLDTGRITVDGTDITAVPRNELRRTIGMVLQDTWLFEGTIADNIAYGRPKPPARRSSRQPAPSTPTTSSAPCPTATTRCSTGTATAASAPGNAN